LHLDQGHQNQQAGFYT